MVHDAAAQEEVLRRYIAVTKSNAGITQNITHKWTKQKNAAIPRKEGKAFCYFDFNDLILIRWS